MVALVDTGAPESAYQVVYQLDQGYQDITQLLPGFNRLPSTYACAQSRLIRTATSSGTSGSR